MKEVKEWYSFQEVTEMYHIELTQLYNMVSILRRSGLVQTIRNPKNQRQTLISADSLNAIKRAFQIEDTNPDVS